VEKQSVTAEQSRESVAPAATATGAPHAFGQRAIARAPERETANLETARRYLAAIEASTAGEPGAAEAFFTPDVVQEEFPNRIVPKGATRDLAALREAAERGRKVLRGQRYEVRSAYAVGDTVILETLWAGTLAVPLGTIPAGGEMRAHFCVVLEFRDGRIQRQRNYDCFEPF
jgi:ketosteroid isomerase-like protein